MKKVWQFITSTKNAVGNLLFLGIIGLILFAVFQQDGNDVPESAVMIINPQGIIVEQTRAVDPVEEFLVGDQGAADETLARDLIEAIDLAADDDRIKALALDLSKLQGSSLSVYEDIADAINDFKTSEKPVYAFGSDYSQSQYYLAAQADNVYLDRDQSPFIGGVFFQGFGAFPLYMKSALDKLEITVHVIKAGDYKDAAEPFMRDDMSDFSRQSNQELVDSLWNSYLDDIAAARDLDKSVIDQYIENYPALIGESRDPSLLALDTGLIDGVVSRQEFRNEMQAYSGAKGDSYNHIGYRNYLASVRPPIPVQNPTSDKIAVIVAKGTILNGDQPAGDIGGDSLARLIRNARNDDTIKGIVLRVDSPGGSSTASELIRSELQATQESGKPVVASMSGLAASGGYWIASTSNKIFASENTITGSIGVYALFPTFENTLQKLGISSDGVGTTPLTGAFNSFRELNPLFETTLQHSVKRTYDEFLGLIAEGRGLTVEEADRIAQGRVWTGAMALEHGLVDAIGDLDAAIDSAALLADVTDYDVVYLEKSLTPKEQLIRQILQSSAGILPPLSTEIFNIIPPELQSLVKMAQSPQVYLHCLSCNVSF